jgi:hypothetical protein
VGDILYRGCKFDTIWLWWRRWSLTVGRRDGVSAASK